MWASLIDRSLFERIRKCQAQAQVKVLRPKVETIRTRADTNIVGHRGMPSCVEHIQLQTMPITWHIPGWASVICWANCQFHTSRANITFGCVDATSGWANATSDRANARLC